MINADKKEKFVRYWAFLIATNMHKQKPFIDELYVFGALKQSLPMILDRFEEEVRMDIKRGGKVA